MSMSLLDKESNTANLIKTIENMAERVAVLERVAISGSNITWNGNHIFNESLTLGKIFNLQRSEVTISSGVIYVIRSYHTVDTESDASSDDLDSIYWGSNGDILILRAADSSHEVVVKHGTGNIYLDGSTDFSLTNGVDTIMLICEGGLWLELSRSNNGA